MKMQSTGKQFGVGGDGGGEGGGVERAYISSLMQLHYHNKLTLSPPMELYDHNKLTLHTNRNVPVKVMNSSCMLI